MKTVALVGTFDTKGAEFAYVKEVLEHLKLQVLTINVGVFTPKLKPDIAAEQIAAAQGQTLADLRGHSTRGEINEILAQGLKKVLPQLYQANRFQGIMSLGGSGGTSLVTPALQELPLGVPKVMVSTVASGDTSLYVGTSDINMFPSIVDVSGLNPVSTMIFRNAACALAGMVQNEVPLAAEDKPVVGATMFGVTTPAVDHARELLAQQNIDTLVFHATGTGGRTLEKLISQGYFQGVLDLTTTEIADQLFGGVLAAGPQRLEAGINAKIPQVIAPGALDMVNFGAWDTVPEAYQQRNLVKHNSSVTLMRTTREENVHMAHFIAQKLNAAQAPLKLVLPTKGFSQLDASGQPFDDPEADQALITTLHQEITNAQVEIIELPYNINDPEFTEYCVQALQQLMAERN